MPLKTLQTAPRRLAFLVPLWLAVSGFTPQPVVATITPLHSLAASVMGERATPYLLIRGAATPHHFTLRPSDVRALRSARVVFWIGPRLEEFLVAPLRRLPGATNVIRLDSMAGGPAADPHIWLDPEIARRIAKSMAAALAASGLAGSSRYNANLNILLARLKSLDAKIRETLAPVRDLPFVVYHDAYSHFVRRYGLHQVAFVVRNSERQAGARRLRAVRRKIVDEGVKCVFVEPQTSPARGLALIRGTRARIGTLDPLGAGLRPGPLAYTELLRNLAASLRDCLAPR